MFYVAYKNGFIGEKLPTQNIRLARPFVSFSAADSFAKEQKLMYYAILRTSNGA